MKKLNNIFQVVAVLCISCLGISCSDDASKITVDLESVSTGEVSDITSTSAVISGYYSYYATIGSMVGEGFEQYDSEDKVSKADLLMLSEKEFKPIVDTLSVDSVTLVFNAYDMAFDQGGICISEKRDFFEGVQTFNEMSNIIYTRGKVHTKTIESFTDEITGLKPGTTYYYKTYLATYLISIYSSPELQNVNGMPWSYIDGVGEYRIEGLKENYVIYGVTKSFTTAP